jgi:ubiquitin C-terminal hydrolase
MAAGFINTGNICYWNALMQCLISCRSINAVLDADSHDDLEVEFKKLYATHNQEQSSKVLRRFLTKLRSNNTSFGTMQESASEGLILLLDVLPYKVNNLFWHRYRRQAICSNCHKGGDIKREETKHFELFEDLPINNPEDFAEQLLYRRSEIDEYKCDHCGVKDRAMREEHLTMTSEIIVILFNKYNAINKFKVAYCPDEFSLPAVNGKFVYRLVGKIHHTGTLNGGHYWASVKRDKWYRADDSSITQIELSNDTLTYIAFYHLV